MPLKVFLLYVFGSFPAVLFFLKYAFMFVFLNRGFNGVFVFPSVSECGQIFLSCCFHVADVSVSIILENRLDILCVL